jgi:hypothetical protein
MASASRLRRFRDFGLTVEQHCLRAEFHAFRMWNKIRCTVFEADVGNRACADDMLKHRTFHFGQGERPERPVWPWHCHGVSRRFAG